MKPSKLVNANIIEAERLLTEAMSDSAIDDKLFAALAGMVRQLRCLVPERGDDDAKARAAASYDVATRVQTLGEVPSVR